MPIALRLDLLEMAPQQQGAAKNIRRIRRHLEDLQHLASVLERTLFSTPGTGVAALPPGDAAGDTALAPTAMQTRKVEADGPVIAVLCFDDNVMLTDALGMRLRLEPDIAWLEPRNVLTGAASVIASEHPDVVLLDLNIPGDIAALDLVRLLREQQSPARVVVLTGNSTVPMADAARAAGVLGFVGKSAAPAVLLDTLRRVAAGETVITTDA